MLGFKFTISTDYLTEYNIDPNLQVELQLNQNNGRITIDGDMELFTNQGRKYSYFSLQAFVK